MVRESTKTDGACPSTQLFGNGFGHQGSTSNAGTAVPDVGACATAFPEGVSNTQRDDKHP